MKPLKLSIQAFGPFAGLQEIDFSLLGESPLFLINGPTGAGKSSILDAICFALYGKTTTDEREASEMRCDQAPPNLATQVILDFSLAGKYYRVSRTPQQERAKTRGEGVTIDNGSASLWEVIDNDELKLIVAKKLKEVTQEIEIITGLNVDQFRQVMVLPQGKFRELLLADSREREKIFGQLFQTHIYKRIEDDLKQQASSISNDVQNLQNQIKGILQAAEVNTENEIQDLLENFTPLLKEAGKHKQETQQSLHEALQKKEAALALFKKFEEVGNTKKKFSELVKQQAGIQDKKSLLVRAILAEKIKPKFNELRRLQEEYQALENEIIQISDDQEKVDQVYKKSKFDYEEAEEAYKDVDQLKQKKQLIEQYREKLGKLKDAKNSLLLADKEFSESSQQLMLTQQKLDSKLNKIAELESVLSSVLQAVSSLDLKQAKFIELSRQNEQFKKVEDLKKSHELNLAEFQSANNKLDSYIEKTRLSLLLVKQQELLWHSGQAINLAKELEQDQPCPVCGSTNHPSPALPDDNHKIVTKEQVESARSQAESDMKQQLEADKRVSNIEHEQKQIDKEISGLEQILGELVKLSKEQMELSLNDLQSEVNSLKAQQKKIATINQNLSDDKSFIESLSLTLTKVEQGNEQLKKQLIQKQSAVSYLLDDIPEDYHDETNVLQELDKISKRVIQLSANLDYTAKQSEKFKTQLTQFETSKLGLQKRKLMANDHLINSNADWQQILKGSVFMNEVEFHLSILDEHNISQINEIIEKFSDQFKALQGVLQQQEKELDNETVPDIEVFEKACIETQQQYQMAEKEWHALDSRVKQLKSVQKKLNSAHDENEQLEAQYAIYGTLSNAANGSNNNKISLQRFVLSVLLDDVLIQATHRLNIMSKGRYQMLRKDARAKGNKASGLELEVEDAYTGKTRSVATLSGGESFMASLALALGLSDVVQAYAGGIKLDTLFIDEGFGSLDQESLDLAIRTLVDLQATGRMIGIISHVTELKEQMALRLDVISSKTGSSVRTVTG